MTSIAAAMNSRGREGEGVDETDAAKKDEQEVRKERRKKEEEGGDEAG